MKCRSLLLTIAVISALAMALVPCNSSSATAAEGDIVITPETDSIELGAGNSTTFTVVVANGLSFDENAPLANERFISIALKIGNKCSASVDDSAFTLKGQDSKAIEISIITDRFSGTGDTDLDLSLTVKDLDGTETTLTKDVHINVHITSELSAGSSFNKILGMFENPLPNPFDKPVFTAIISFVLWVLIGLIIVLMILPLFLRAVTRHDKEEGKLFVKRTKKAFFLVVLLWSLSKSLRVFGADEYTVGTFETYFSIIYVILGSVIIWRIYAVFIHHALKKLDREMGIAEEDEGADDLEPLMKLIGKLVIVVFAIAIIMAAMGFDLAAIITSAGLATLGISLGAQNVLSQFFSGLVLLATRPFKAGDLVHIGTNTATYKVITVTIMNTKFENWDNDEVIIMPNNAVTTAAITNMTGNGLPYKIHIFMTVAYGENLDKAKEIMLGVAHRHEGIINDGTYDKPYCRITSLGSSDISIRLTCFVYDFNNYGVISGQLRESIYKAFVENGICIPFPQMDVHIDYKADADKNTNETE